MKILVISDSHGNIANLKHVMGFAKKIKVGAVIHCGDWNTKESVETVLTFGIPLYSILGNADIDPEIGKRLKVKGKRFDRVFLEFELDGKKIGVIHDIHHLPLVKSIDILFFGHWQKQKKISRGGINAINPGALENDVNFVVYDTASGKIEFINNDQT